MLEDFDGISKGGCNRVALGMKWGNLNKGGVLLGALLYELGPGK